MEIIGQPSEVKLGNIEPNREVQYFRILSRARRASGPIFSYCLNTIYFSNIDYWATQKAILDLTDRFNKEILGPSYTLGLIFLY